MIRLLNRWGVIALLAGTIICLPFFASAEGYVNLVGLPGLNEGGNPDMQVFLNSVFRIAIIAAGLIAVIKLVLAGSKYVLSGIVTEKSDAKQDIYSALIGLLIILSAVMLLRTINPDILNLPALQRAPTPAQQQWEQQTHEEQLEENCSNAAVCVIENCDPPGGPTMCQTTQERCTSGEILPGGESGTAQITQQQGTARLFCIESGN